MQKMLEEKDSSDINFDEQLEAKFPDKQTKKSDISNISLLKN